MPTLILSPIEEKAAMRNIIWSQCLAIVALGTVGNGTLLLYLTAIGTSAVRTMIYLAILPLTNAALLLPAAFLADRYGKKRIGQIGLTVGIFGWGIISLGSLTEDYSESLVVIGLILAAVCSSLIGAGWFSLLSPIIPAETRGRFFSRLRLTFSLVSLILSISYAWILSVNSSVMVYEGIYALATLAYIIRWFVYRRIPELEPPERKTDNPSFLRVLLKVIRNKNLTAFCSYMFLLGLFTAGSMALFAMTEKRVLDFTATRIILLSNVTLVGGMFGMFLGGRIVDRHGTRLVFAACHILLAFALMGFLLRIFTSPAVLPFYLGSIHFLLGGAMGAIGIAMTTELLGVLPKENKSVAASMFIIFQTSGVALSGLIPAGILKANVLRDIWEIGGHQLSSFDAILAGYSLMTLVLVATLGLVPSMLRKSEPASLGLNRL
ncbi:MAG: MFS transporter [Verrucomicrobia bacterium]|nr:MFS transporter [Verrucomicrobiota bacterium]